jgi:AcrR family transcriptional regulator
LGIARKGQSIRMGKIDENKKKKKETLFNSAYDLFITKGINSTAISDIVEKAGVAKGTFYLYFKDKYDIRNKLIAHKTHELFHRAKFALDHAPNPVIGLDEQLIFIINHIIDTLVLNIPLMNFISKNLVMGALRSVLLTGERSDTDFYEIFLDMVRQDSYEYQDIEVMLFTIVELAGSAGYNSILYKEPLPIEQYKPFLYRSVRLIIDSHRVKDQAGK